MTLPKFSTKKKKKSKPIAIILDLHYKIKTFKIEL